MRQSLLKNRRGDWQDGRKSARPMTPTCLSGSMALSVKCQPMVTVASGHYCAANLRRWQWRSSMPNGCTGSCASMRCCWDENPEWGSTPESQIFPSPQFKPGNQRIQVNNLIAALEGVMPVQQNMLPSHWRYPGQSLNVFGIPFRFQSSQQTRQDRGVVINDRVGDQPHALITDFRFNVIFPG